jgi:hypothetical protein
MKRFLALAAAALLSATASFAAAPQATPEPILPGGNIKFVPLVHQRHNPARFVIRAEVKWFGNSYCRMPNGTIAGTCKYCEWEGCYIVVDGKTIRLSALPGNDIVDQQNYRGKTLVLVGLLLQQPLGKTVPPDVLIVDRFWMEP